MGLEHRPASPQSHGLGLAVDQLLEPTGCQRQYRLDQALAIT
jgi:hypothetical protein